jgi:hypothetical protein
VAGQPCPVERGGAVRGGPGRVAHARHTVRAARVVSGEESTCVAPTGHCRRHAQERQEGQGDRLPLGFSLPTGTGPETAVTCQTGPVRVRAQSVPKRPNLIFYLNSKNWKN